MFVIKMMTSKVEGFKVAGYVDTPEQANKKIDDLKRYYNPIDIYYAVNN